MDTSKTSLNQVPAIVKKYTDELKGHTVLNYGAGRYPQRVIEHLNESVVLSYDPYVPSIAEMPSETPTRVVCANVLNVIQDDDDIHKTLKTIRRKLPHRSGKVFISIYEGDKSGIGKVTSRGYQRNQKASEYQIMMEMEFDTNNVSRKGNVFIIDLTWKDWH